MSATAHDLAHAPGFALGPLDVDPPSRRVSAGGRSAMLEPRVMRVLVALGGAEGAVLSRNDLIEHCWDGVIVGDNAINRAIAQLRHVLDDLGGGAVQLETITKVGFRLVSGEATNGLARPNVFATTPRASAMTRRAAAAGGVLVLGAGAAFGFAAWRRPARHVPDPRAVELYRRGQAILKAGVKDSMGEALETYKQAVVIDPRYADAWGALALTYRSGHPTRLSDPQVVRAAAQRALALDPGNADARLALIMLYPYYRRWREREARLRAFLRDHPDSALGHARLGWLLFNVGRFENAVTLAQRAIDFDATLQTGWILLAHASYYAGRDSQGDFAIDEARSRWPQDPQLYVNGYHFVLLSKRYSEALAFLRDTGPRPRMLRREQVESWMRQADGLATGRGLAELKNSMRTDPPPASVQIQGHEIVAPIFALLGMADEMFALLEAYFFGGVVNGTRIDPPGPLGARFAGTLFAPALAALRGDPRFASLLVRTGLEDYWRKSGTRPDFRRGVRSDP